LGCARGFGDYDLQLSLIKDNYQIKTFLTAKPDIFHIKLDESCESSNPFVILSSDGLWDTINNKDCVKVIRYSMIAKNVKDSNSSLSSACSESETIVTSHLQLIAQNLVDLAVDRLSGDDISVFAIPLTQVLKIKKTKELVESTSPISLNKVIIEDPLYKLIVE